MNDLLLEQLAAALRSGAIPTPLSGESLDDYRFRAAHAGALVGVQWYLSQVAEQIADQANPDPGRHGGAPVAPPVGGDGDE